MGLELHLPLQTHLACGISSPAQRTSALPNNGCATERMTAKTVWTRACRSAVSALSDATRSPLFVEKVRSMILCMTAPCVLLAELGN